MKIKEWFLTWFKAARAPFLILSLLPALLAGALAYYHGIFDSSLFWIVTLGAVMAHSAGDFIDDYHDYKNGNLGNKEQQFHDSPLIHKKVSTSQVMIAFLVCLGIAFASGIYAFIKVGQPVIVLALIGTFIVFFYTSPPFKMNYRGFGETMLFVAFGPMIVIGIYYVLSREFSLEATLLSIPLGIFTMNVGIVSNTFDYDDDVLSGKKCLPVRFGQANAVRVLAVATVLAYLSLIVGLILGVLPLWTGIGLLTIPLSISVVKAVSKYENLKNYTPAMSKAIGLSSVMGLLLIISYIIEISVK
jgi:1,4-dihydroxy-2-naphthoate octaprenyltransferase